jgi:hypothetical protein
MRKIVVLFFSVLLLSNCVSKRESITNSGVAALGSIQKFTLKEEAVCHLSTLRFWLLFVPIGGKTYNRRKEKVIKKFMEKNKADGFIDATLVESYVVVPFIAVTLVFRTTRFTAKPCKKHF